MKSKALLFCAALIGGALPIQAETHLGLNLNIGVPLPIVVHREPPRPVVEQMIAAPGAGYVWVAGHYTWLEGRWLWVRGAWVLPPQPGAVWVAGRWEHHNRTWIEGHWEIPVPAVTTVPMAPAPPPRNSEIYVEGAPPPPQTEVIVAAPAPDYSWIPGYWGWNMGRHVWIAGRWERPPHGFHTWVAPRWERRGHGYVFVRGSWR